MAVRPATTNIENDIMPPPRRAMGPARNRRRLNWPVPITHRGGGSAEGAQKFYFLIKKNDHKPRLTPYISLVSISQGNLQH